MYDEDMAATDGAELYVSAYVRLLCAASTVSLGRPNRDARSESRANNYTPRCDPRTPY